MTFPEGITPLINKLPSVKGILKINAPIAKFTWFRVGGPAEILFEPADQEDLQNFLAKLSPEIPVTVLGAGSNTIIRDYGVEGVIIKLGRKFSNIQIQNSTVSAGAGAMNILIARKAKHSGVANLEFFNGIPGTLGGALQMNAGAYDFEIKDILLDVDALDRFGNLHHANVKELQYNYRKCNAPEDWIFTSARLKGKTDNPKTIAARMRQAASVREKAQPIRERTGGSTFKNPPNQKAWKLIEVSGCRGLRRGGAQVSNSHCNFLINRGSATAEDLESLGEDVRARVKKETGILLEWEIVRIGRNLSKDYQDE